MAFAVQHRTCANRASDYPFTADLNAGAAGEGTGGHTGQMVAACVQAYIGVGESQGQRRRMEDRHTILPDFQLSPRSAGLPHQFAAVFDGHAGSHASELAAARLHEIIADQPEILAAPGLGAPDDLAVRDGLVRAFLTLDAEMARQGSLAGPGSGAGSWGGTTAVCALRIGGFVYIAHAGDSCALLCRRGHCLRLTADHKPASCPGERARIEGRGGTVVPELDAVVLNAAVGRDGEARVSRLCMSRALGDVEFKTPVRLVEAAPDVVRVVLQPGDDEFILLASDGILENMTEEEAVATVRQAVHGQQASDATAGAVAGALVQRALHLRTKDNATAVVILLSW